MEYINSVTIFNIKSHRWFCLKGMNPVIFTLSGCPGIGLTNESNIGKKASMTWYLEKSQYDLVAAMFEKVYLHPIFSSTRFSRINFIVVPSWSKHVYCLSNILFKYLLQVTKYTKYFLLQRNLWFIL